MLITTNTEQEARWLYAKGLELAILIKGAPGNLGKDETVNSTLDMYYQKLTSYMVQRIVENGKELQQEGKILVKYP